MAALKEIAREYASEIRDGIGWVIVYCTGRSWHALTVWSDLSNNEWETDDINDALEALRLDPRAVALNGYYLGRFGDMTVDDIAAGLPFSERLVDGSEDKINPYIYDGSMTPEDYDAMQAVREAHDALAAAVAGHFPGADPETVERIAEAADSLKLTPETMQRILDAFDKVADALKRLAEWAVQAIKKIADFFSKALDDFLLRRAPPKWRHYALHAKRARVRKKYRDRIRRAFFASLATEGGGSS